MLWGYNRYIATRNKTEWAGFKRGETMKAIVRWLLALSLFVGSAFAVKLTAPDGLQDRFGYFLAVSGNTLVVSEAYTVGYSGGQTVYVYQKGHNWNHPILVAELTASNGDYLMDVAISGNTIVAGAPAATVNGVQYQGCAYVFVAGEQGWQNANETAKLTSSDGYSSDSFGIGVAIDSQTIVIGALGAGNLGQGEAYVFTKPVSGWMSTTETARLSPSNGQHFDSFGSAVSVKGVVAAAGAPGVDVSQGYAHGAVYLFKETPGGWQNMTETAELTDGQPEQYEDLGFSVVIEGGTVVAGAPCAGNPCYLQNEGTGRALVYLESAGGWQSTTTPNAILTSTEVNPLGFGDSVAINANLIVVGDPYASTNYKNTSGAAFTFKKPPSGWVNATQSAKLVAPGQGVGTSVAAWSNSVVFIGAPSSSADKGAVFITSAP
jgi:hypothetical protein